MNITLNRGGLIGALALAAYTTLWVYLSLRGLDQVARLTEMSANALVAGVLVGAFVGNSLWAMVLKARASASPTQSDR